jgi:hypothetical protein
MPVPLQQGNTDGTQRKRSNALGGLLERRERWTLSLRGKLLGIALVLVAVLLVQQCVHPFLAVTQPVASELLVVEGWVPPDTLHEAAIEFRRGGYRRLILLSSFDYADNFPLERYEDEYKTKLLIHYGVPSDRETTLYPLRARKDRTYHSALDLKEWLAGHGMNLKSLDVATCGPHARRTRLLYQKAFGKDVKIGIIALSGHDYDPSQWWKSSEGVREVIGEVIAYLYARFLFRASAS